jgi:TLD
VLLFRAEDDSGKVHNFGGYSSHGWDSEQKGDATCFLFNLTENLKFSTITRTYMSENGDPKYSWVSKDARDAYEEQFSHQKNTRQQLYFGQKELVV